MLSPRVSRVLRGTVAGTFATFVALMSHVAAGGALPGWVGIAVPLVLSALLCIVVAGRGLSAIRTGIGVVASQFFFHTLFILGTATTSSADPVMGHHNHGAMIAAPGESTVALIAADTTMWGWHALAAGVTAFVLHRAEHAVVTMRRTVRALATWLRRVIVALVGVLVIPVRTTRGAVDVAVARPLDRLFIGSAWRRGPPVARVL